MREAGPSASATRRPSSRLRNSRSQWVCETRTNLTVAAPASRARRCVEGAPALQGREDARVLRLAQAVAAEDHDTDREG